MIRTKRSTSAPLAKLLFILQYSPPSGRSEFTRYLVQRATAVHLQATTPCLFSVFYLSASTVLCEIHLVIPQAGSTKPQLLLPKWRAYYQHALNQRIWRITPNSLYDNKHQIIIITVPALYKKNNIALHLRESNNHGNIIRIMIIIYHFHGKKRD